MTAKEKTGSEHKLHGEISEFIKGPWLTYFYTYFLPQDLEHIWYSITIS